MAENPLERAIEKIADDRPVDWAAIEGDARSGEDGECLKWLRVLGEIARVHRSAPSEPHSSARPTADAPEARQETEGEPDLWGRYRLVAKLGEGSFGRVHRAWDPQLEREVAIKILHQHVADGELKQALLREGRALARVRHPNVVSVLGVEFHGDRVGLCMEFIRGETLESEIRARRTLGAREAALVGQDICQALAAVHRAGFVHRDVKARNVMREQGGRIVLMDFGTGREIEIAGGGRLDIAGTPVYMAPEVLTGAPATPGGDVYSVGVLMFHMVTGEYPVEGGTMDELREAHRLGRRTLLSERRPDLPLPFVQVIERALAPDPGQRYRTSGALLTALAPVAGDEHPSIGRRALVAASAAAGAICTLMAIGMLTSRAFNSSLGRSDFADETWWDWLVWGARASVGPVVILIVIVASLGLCVVGRSLLLALSRTARVLDVDARRRTADVARRLGLDDVHVLASAVLLLSGLALVVAWWHFSPLLNALLRDKATAPPDTLALLAPAATGDLNPYHLNYRYTFSWIADVSILLWYFLLRAAAKKREPLHWGVLAGGGAIVILSLGTLDFPFRLLNYWDNQFDGARWRGADCYVLGARGDDLLLFCPSLQPSRNRIVKRDDQDMERTGLHESIFSRFAENDPTR